MAPHSSTLAWKIPWAEEPGRLRSTGSLRVRHDWATSLWLFTSCIGERNGNPLQCFCLENPRDRRAWWAAVYGVAQNQTRLKWLSIKVLFNICLHHSQEDSGHTKCVDVGMTNCCQLDYGHRSHISMFKQDKIVDHCIIPCLISKNCFRLYRCPKYFLKIQRPIKWIQLFYGVYNNLEWSFQQTPKRMLN